MEVSLTDFKNIFALICIHSFQRKKKIHGKVIDPDVDFRKIKSIHTISSFYAIMCIVFITFLGYLAKHMLYSLPDYKTNQDAVS